MSGTGVTGEIVRQEQVAAVAAAIDDSAAALPSVAAASRASGARFRQFDLTAASGELAAIAENLNSLLVLTDAIGTALWGSDARRRLEGSGITRLAACVDGLIDARASSDWIQVADILEYDVPALVDCWSTLFAAMRKDLAACQR